MSSYFSLPSFARAKQNKEQLEKTNPKNPVLNDEDEKFLNKQIESGEAPEGAKDAAPTKITESGEEKEATKEEVDQAAATSPDQVAVPEEQPEAGDGVQESKQEEPKVDSTKEEEPKQDEPQAEAGQQEEPKAEKGEAEEPKIEEPKAEEAKGEPAKPEDDPQENADDPPEQTPDESTGKAEAPIAKAKKEKKNKSLDLPSQEEAEAATKGFNAGGDKPDKPQAEQGEKRTWASYLPSVGSGAKKDQSADEKPAEAPKEGETAEQAEKRTWAQYASSAYSALPSIPSLPSTWKSKDGKAEPVYNEDGTVNEEKTKEKQEQEVSVLLDNLNMSSINNRVFAFSGETQKIYERFAQVLKDTMNGGPTAYEDMEKLMKDAGPELEKQFKSMPPFVQTLVKSLPAKLGTTLGPELLAAASEKPGGDMQARMAAASKKPSGGDPSIQTASSSSAPTAETTDKDGKKQKRKIPGLKGLVSQQGAVASILRNVVNFLTTRFPFLASATNVVMSLAVFILMFVFWYCHKRGKEARLAKELEAGKEGKVAEEAADEEVEMEVTDEEEAEEEVGEEGEEEKDTAAEAEPEPVAEQEDSAEAVTEKTEKTKEEVLEQSEPSEVPVPDQEKGEKGAELEATKSVGT